MTNTVSEMPTSTPAASRPLANAEPLVPRGTGAARILCVDDEPDVLESLRRTLGANGYLVQVADSAAGGLLLLEGESFDLVLADQVMPNTDGAQFLAQVQVQWPQTIRMLMAGAADAPVQNAAAIHGHIAKPWNEHGLMTQVRKLLDLRGHEEEKRQRARSRAEELRALNASLEQNASANQDELAQANKQLKSNFIVTLKVFGSLIETRRKHLVGHARRVANLARKLATQLQLEPALVHEVLVAGLLHDLGKLAFPDALLDTPVANMTPRQLDFFRQHPARAEQLLMPLQDLRGAAASIAAQLERFDGTGFPRQLQGRAILVGARILAVCADYDNLQIGMLGPRWLTPRQALAVIERAAGKRYDPWVVEAFSAMLRGKPDVVEAEQQPEVQAHPIASNLSEDVDDLLVGVNDLGPGDVLSRDLVTPAGLMMLPAGHTIDDRLIKKMADFERTDNVELAVYIRKPADDVGGTAA
ncbi:MAG: HD domain-containing phosphohydrolase [Burkholderiaceae bacterium]